MIKLHIGCGKDRKSGYENIDLYEGPIKMPMDKLDYPKNYAEEILSNHTLEHIGHKKTESVLKEWFRVLKPGGIIRITVPDTIEIFKRWIADNSLDSFWYQALWGQQKSPGHYHYSGFTKVKIERLFEKVGFREIKALDYSDLKKSGFIKIKIERLFEKVGFREIKAFLKKSGFTKVKIERLFEKVGFREIKALDYPKRRTPSIMVTAKK